MNGSHPERPADRDLDGLAVALVQKSSLLTRLVFQHVDGGLPRSEAGVLARLAEAPKRISALAEAESLAQPTVTLVVKRLEQLALVQRRADPEDGRATLVSLTPAGHEKLAEVRAAYRAFLSERLTRLPGGDLDALEQSMHAMNDLIELIQSAGVPAQTSRTILPSLPPAANRS